LMGGYCTAPQQCALSGSSASPKAGRVDWYCGALRHHAHYVFNSCLCII
jgi:hypothetical protein